MHKFITGQDVIFRSGTRYRILSLIVEPDGSPAYRVCQYRDKGGWYGRVFVVSETDLRPVTGWTSLPLNERYRR